MLTTERAPFTIQWEANGVPARVDPNVELLFTFDPSDSGTIEGLTTVSDGRTATSTTTTGFVSAGQPAVSAACDCLADADPGTGFVPIVLRATFSVEAPEAVVTSGTFQLGAPEPKP